MVVFPDMCERKMAGHRERDLTREGDIIQGEDYHTEHQKEIGMTMVCNAKITANLQAGKAKES
jgi:hypothetical protein